MATIMEALGGRSGETIMEVLGGESGETIADVIEETGLKPASTNTNTSNVVPTGDDK